MGYYLDLNLIEGRTPEVSDVKQMILNMGWKQLVYEYAPDSYNLWTVEPVCRYPLIIQFRKEMSGKEFAYIRLSFGCRQDEIEPILRFLTDLAEKIPFELYDGQIECRVTRENYLECVEKIIEVNRKFADMLGRVVEHSEPSEPSNPSDAPPKPIRITERINMNPD